MIDALLTEDQSKEALSKAYVACIAARAGYDTVITSFDMDSIDIGIRAGGGMRPSIDIQLKATVTLDESDGKTWRFQLKRKNYDDLRRETIVPRYLVVLRMPRDKDAWLITSDTELTLQHCAYWVSLRGMADTDRDSKNIAVPKINTFNVDSLKGLMQAARDGRTV